MSGNLITGATGFIGHHLARMLRSQDLPVRCLVRDRSRAESLQQLGCEIRQVDLADVDGVAIQLEGIARVYHLAGATTAVSEAEFLRVNDRLFGSVLQACTRVRFPPTVVFASSVAAAGPSAREHRKSEQDWPAPISAYGRSKLAAERRAATFANRVPITVLRPGIVLGPGDRASLSIFRAIKQTRIHVSPGWHAPKFSIIFADELTQLMPVAAERGERLSPASEPGQRGVGIYHACRDETPDYLEIGRLASEAQGIGWHLNLKVPTPIPYWVGRFGDLYTRVTGKTTLLNSDKMAEATAGSWAFSNDKAKQDLGFVAPRDLADQFRAAVEGYRQAGWL